MEVIPAIDIRGGRAVRLTEGNFQSETVYGDDPLAIAHRHRQAGARRVHVVDLDAALGRAGNNREIVSRIVAEAGSRSRWRAGCGTRRSRPSGSGRAPPRS